MNKIRIAIVDDHQIVIDGISALLQDRPNFDIVASTVSPIQMLNLLKENPVDILLTDIVMPELTGQQLAKKVKENFPDTKILALSMSGQGDVVSEMINDSDISGYVLKNIGKQELSIAIEKIASGGIYFSDQVLNELERISHVKKRNEEVHLTQREIEIIRLIEKEMSNKEIADTLSISERTVETHRKNIFRRPKLGSVVDLIRYAYEQGLINEK